MIVTDLIPLSILFDGTVPFGLTETPLYLNPLKPVNAELFLVTTTEYCNIAPVPS